MSATALRVDDLVVEYVHDGYAIRPLDGLSFAVEPGELAVLLGPSGSGKTTLLSCVGGILTPTSGSIRVGELEVTGMERSELERYRREHVGFVFQAFNLIPSLTARENVAMPLMLTGWSRHSALERADELLAEVGLSDRAGHRPARLSGGQQQRVAVARGLARNPPLLLADEPTANLDHIQAEAIIRLLQELRGQGRAIVVSTHDARLVPIADRIIEMVPEAVDADRSLVGTNIELAPGEVLFHQDDPSDFVYRVESGDIEIIRNLADGGEELLNVMHPGQYFGELGPFLGFPRSATARARGSAVLRVHDPNEFRSRVLTGE
jgi:putative ABC transport system ATP-binding protein